MFASEFSSLALTYDYAAEIITEASENDENKATSANYRDKNIRE